MPNGRDTMAQAVYLAQLQACKGKCQCNVCQILRKAADQMSEDFLNPSGSELPGIKEAKSMVKAARRESLTFEEEED